MTYSDYDGIIKNKRPGDRVWSVRKNAFTELTAEEWPSVKPVSGTLQSSYFNRPSAGPYPPRHLLADSCGSGDNAWDSPWWDLEHWALCDTEAEALAELERQKQEIIKNLEYDLAVMRGLLKTPPPWPAGMTVYVPEKFAGGLPEPGSEVRVTATGILEADRPAEGPLDGTMCRIFWLEPKSGSVEKL